MDAGYTTPHSAGVMVCSEDGYLSLLEIYSVTDEPITAWPSPHFGWLIACRCPSAVITETVSIFRDYAPHFRE
ncbi:hypothetical protein [Streptomyces sp. NPDC050759]|uniref:hypothetical protein n=1 Tax=Streptomyces sp. NPDC050759 TaxID=3365635 RepID=UPI00378CEC72